MCKNDKKYWNLFVDDFVNSRHCGNHEGGCGGHEHKKQGSCGGSCHNNDNREELFKRFRLVFDETHTRLAAGYKLVCTCCGKAAFSKEEYFPCKETFVPVVVRCKFGCGARWDLEIDVVVPENIRVAVH